MLHGRGGELAALDTLVSSARDGAGGALVVSGEAGAGKSALLDRAATGPVKVLRAAGVEPESGMAFAALHQLLRPVAGLVERLPEPQRDALRGALGVEKAPADRFLVAAGVLSLLTEAASEGGLLVLADDVQWFDAASADALAFTARRLGGEGVALVLAARGEVPPWARGLDQLRLGGLGLNDVGALLAERAPVPPAPAVVARLAASTGGNPLALAEAAELLTPGQWEDREPLPDPLPAGAAIFAGPVAALGPAARRLLLVAALDGPGDPDVILAAAGGDGLAEAEASGLVTVGATVTFRHPLVRAAAVAEAGPALVREAHTALAAAVHADPDRRALHLAGACVGGDSDVARQLAASAERARRRGGFADAAAALIRAAALTPGRGLRAGRQRAWFLFTAARDAWLGGHPGQAAGLLADAREMAEQPVLFNEIARLHGRFQLNSGDVAEAARVLLAAATERPSVEALADASEAASHVGDVPAIIAAGRLAEPLERGFLRDVIVGVGAVLDGDASGVTLLREALGQAGDLEDAAMLLWAGAAASYLGEADAAAGFVARAGERARVSGLTGQLPVVLEFVATGERIAGRLAHSAAVAEEGLALAREAGYVNSVPAHLANLAAVSAIRGDEDACRAQAAEALSVAIPHRIGLRAGTASYALGLLDLGLGRHAAAHDRFTALAAAGPGRGHPTVTWRSSPDRIEAAVGAGDRAGAAAILADFERWSAGATSTETRALLARSRALVAEPEAALGLLSDAVAVTGGSPFEHARSALLYGERLRRAQRPAEARGHLRSAMEAFARLGAAPWTERAHGELRAAGESTEEPVADVLAALTPQELRIARMVGAGASSKEVAARLFLSPRTVEYHLYKVYPKLGVTSRTELARLLGDQ
ncbi:helix-turn-helix transcriptional regulator [Phytomonospora endophytica]|uniref:DNA-binding CsgD family transcriptional regulator n=1 Tax=Phytomonospora endophytica TaxID=714109 RepID=A0A841FHG7_9ACTN|nr:LuxR family transcriptional regulator [Phytomonospora endophytica]MBB6034423.1 DNA-binding CsgD family transcriptional regulator [Phytomonospora endophytica]